MTSTAQSPPKLIHIARINGNGALSILLFLWKMEPNRFVWFEERQGRQTETEIFAHTIEEAIKCALAFWKEHSMRFIHCGFRYTLPERDEHGLNALYYQMSASYSSMNGIYYDEELGNNCFVQSASIEALDLWKRMQK